MAPLDSYKAYAMAQADDPDSEFAQHMQAADAKAQKCQKKYLGSKKMKQRIKGKQGKQLKSALLAASLTEQISVATGFFSPRILEVADQLEAMNLTTLSGVAKSGAQFNRSYVEFFREEPGGSILCRFAKKASSMKSWTSKKLDKAYMASLPRSQADQDRIAAQMDADQAVLQEGIQKMRDLGASEKQLEDYTEFFTLYE